MFVGSVETVGPITVERDREVVMRDGVVLRADVYRPGNAADLPVLVQRTPYDKSVYTELGVYYANAGYIFVMQDVRGQFASGGVWEPFVNEADDGFDTVAWAAALPGSDGRVGLVGTSYQGYSAWRAALLRPPALAAMACAVTPVDPYDWFFPGGAFSLAFAVTWLTRNVASSAVAKLPDGAELSEAMTRAYDALGERWYRHLPLNEFPPLLPDRADVAPYFFEWINEHPIRDDYWRDLSLRGRLPEVQVPVLTMAGWYDVFVPAGVETFRALRGAGAGDVAEGSRLVIGPWAHNGWSRELGEVDFGADAARSFPGAVVAWMDHRLKGVTPESEETPVRYFSMGDRTWRAAETWPPEGFEPTRFLLRAGGALAESGPGEDGPGEEPDHFVYDPSNPVPSVGGQSCCYTPQSSFGPYDQRAVESRPDVLVYATPPLTEPLEVAGGVRVELFASSSAPDTDFTAKLVDIGPDSRAINLCEGIVRARHRDGTGTERFLEPGRAERFEIELQPTANVFGVGHRVGVEISSSNFPTYDRNPNTGAPFGRSAALRTARQTILHDAGHPSALILHVRR
ncbi:CocE/NonD family hydrolase [Streptosporangium sp. NPDC051022]|uniref:CocE/NonD family hydrolase n=1 Tax=Streptosporangium sp. NPDC051022 TaxID=3155752 RepID=UPI00343FDA5D